MEKKGMVTVKDIAREAGVSYSTVSVAIGNRKTRIPIAPATREKVLAAARKLGYRRNGLSDQMRTGQTKTISFVMGSCPQEYELKVLLGVQRAACEQGYFVRVWQVTGDPESAYEKMLEMPQDAVILSGAGPRQEYLVRELRKLNVPLACADCKIDLGFDVSIYSDAERGEMEAVEYLYEKGIRHFVFVSDDPEKHSYVAARKSGFEKALALHHLKGMCFERPERIPELPAQLREKPVGIVCSSDFIALRFAIAALSAGFRIPADFRMIGFGCLDFQAIMKFPTVSQNFEKMGECAARKVIARIGVSLPPENLRIPTTIVEPEAI